MVTLHMHSYVAEGIGVAIDVERLDRCREIFAILFRDLDLPCKVAGEV